MMHASDLVYAFLNRAPRGNLTAAAGALEEVALRLERTQLKAPFSGRVA